jgi:AraC family transcriptional regulator
LDGDVELERAARIAGCSSFAFQRIFSYLADVPVAEYIRRRRLSLAAMELASTDTKVIDVAMKWGYSNPVSFARAFTQMEGVKPSEVRKGGNVLRNYPRILFQMTVKGAVPMEYRIEKKDRMRLIGVRKRIDCTDGNNFVEIPRFWDDVENSDVSKAIMKGNDIPSLACLGVCADGDADGFDYWIAAGSTKPIPSDLEELILAPATYAVFPCVGSIPSALQALWRRVFSEWFPQSGYVPEGAQIEWYGEGDAKRSDYRSEIWIAVKKSV